MSMVDQPVSLPAVGEPFPSGSGSALVTEKLRRSAELLRPSCIIAAQLGQTITYGQASLSIDGYQGHGHLAQTLDLISEDCLRRKEPSLAAVVVNGQTGRCGESFLGDEDTERADLHDHWSRQRSVY